MIKTMAGSLLEVVTTGSTFYKDNTIKGWAGIVVLQAESIGGETEPRLLLMEYIKKEAYDNGYETPQIAELNKIIHNLKEQLSDKDRTIARRESQQQAMVVFQDSLVDDLLVAREDNAQLKEELESLKEEQKVEESVVQGFIQGQVTAYTIDLGDDAHREAIFDMLMERERAVTAREKAVKLREEELGR